MATKKYRPYFSLAELKVLHSLSFSSHQSSPLTKYLGSYILQIEEGYKASSYTLKPSVSESLGFSSSSEDSKHDAEQQRRYLDGEMSPQEESDYEKANGISL